MTPKQRKFAEAYVLRCFYNASAAARSVGLKGGSAEVMGSRWLADPEVKAYVAEIRAKLAAEVEVEAKDLVRRWLLIASADPNELVEHRREPCGECWPPDAIQDAPNAECPHCKGEGRGRVVIADTRNLSEAGRLLYRGVQITKDGVKVLMADQDKAVENIARHLAMFKDKIEHSVSEDFAEALIRARARAQGKPPQT